MRSNPTSLYTYKCAVTPLLYICCILDKKSSGVSSGGSSSTDEDARNKICKKKYKQEYVKKGNFGLTLIFYH